MCACGQCHSIKHTVLKKSLSPSARKQSALRNKRLILNCATGSRVVKPPHQPRGLTPIRRNQSRIFEKFILKRRTRKSEFPNVDVHVHGDSTAHCLPQCSATNSGGFTPRHWNPSPLHSDPKNPAAVSLRCHLHTFRSKNIIFEVDQSWERNTRVGSLIVATIYLQLIQNRYMFRSFTVLQCSHQHCVQPVASDVEVVGYL